MKKVMCREVNLMNFVPFFMRDVLEFKHIVDTENIEFDLLQDVGIDMMSNQFVQDSTEYGVERWEKILNLVPSPNESLEDRKRMILIWINNTAPYTIRNLKKILMNMCEEDLEIYYENETFTLTIRFFSDLHGKLEKIQGLLNEIVPANLVVNVIFGNENYLLTETGEFLRTEKNENILI